MKKEIINIEVKTACGKPCFKASAKLVVYAPAPQVHDILNNSYLFSKDGFQEMLSSYDGNIIHSRTGNIQSFHWVDACGIEYRPKASKKIERHIQSYIEVTPTVADLFEMLEIDSSDFEDRLTANLDRLTAERDHGKGYDGAFGEALEVSIKQVVMPRSKYLKYKTPAAVHYGDAQLRTELSLEEIAEMLGIE